MSGNHFCQSLSKATLTTASPERLVRPGRPVRPHLVPFNGDLLHLPQDGLDAVLVHLGVPPQGQALQLEHLLLLCALQKTPASPTTHGPAGRAGGQLQATASPTPPTVPRGAAGPGLGPPAAYPGAQGLGLAQVLAQGEDGGGLLLEVPLRPLPVPLRHLDVGVALVRLPLLRVPRERVGGDGPGSLEPTAAASPGAPPAPRPPGPARAPAAAPSPAAAPRAAPGWAAAPWHA